MRRILFTSSLLAIGMVTMASTAFARGDGWQSAGVPPSFTTRCGSTTVSVTPIANKEFIRLLKQQPDGTTVSLVTGQGKARLQAPNGATLEINASGPAKLIQYPNGDFEIQETGQTFSSLPPAVAAILGIPPLAALHGPFDVLLKADGSVVAIRIPNVVRDLCTELLT
jgi:hypothetical protein